MRNVGVNVLGIASRNESMVLQIKDLRAALPEASISAAHLGSSLLSTHCYVNWPYLQVGSGRDRVGQGFSAGPKPGKNEESAVVDVILPSLHDGCS